MSMRGRVVGLVLAATAAALWAIGGIAAQELFTHHDISPGWLVEARMCVGGLILLAVFRPAWPRGHTVRLIAIATVGIAVTQFTWFEAIEHSNVALATFVQYSAVAMTAAWQMAFRQVRPTALRVVAVALAATGVWLLSDAGLSRGADGLGIALALVSAVTYSFHLLNSGKLVRVVGSRSVTGWGLFVGSVPLLVWTPPWTVHPVGSPWVVAALIAFVAIGSTTIAFSLAMASLRRITPTEFAVTGTLEPALAAVIAAIFLGVTLHPAQYLGGFLTVLAVLLLALVRGSDQPETTVLPRSRPSRTPAATRPRPRRRARAGQAGRP
jgi:drug/metabolite transporter (DMT)-like permease